MCTAGMEMGSVMVCAQQRWISGVLEDECTAGMEVRSVSGCAHSWDENGDLRGCVHIGNEDGDCERVCA